jgi:NADPH:quinone reductase-like Zn-dependent oxidoreductase
VRAAALNPADLALQARALDGAADTFFPVIPGWDITGEVERPRSPPPVRSPSHGEEVGPVRPLSRTARSRPGPTSSPAETAKQTARGQRFVVISAHLLTVRIIARSDQRILGVAARRRAIRLSGEYD